uniref:Sensory/regulatory protein RpfC n=1 Tax=Magnetococcus massalia (strain MO-1) TaxID=451514 RepID=A0A1S7LIZ7_MAGMO|nr:putative hybrid Histidine kinase with response regulator receiver domain [Candidatus Magnetococcus massalia]
MLSFNTIKNIGLGTLLVLMLMLAGFSLQTTLRVGESSAWMTRELVPYQAQLAHLHEMVRRARGLLESAMRQQREFSFSFLSPLNTLLSDGEILAGHLQSGGPGLDDLLEQIKIVSVTTTSLVTPTHDQSQIQDDVLDAKQALAKVRGWFLELYQYQQKSNPKLLEPRRFKQALTSIAQLQLQLDLLGDAEGISSSQIHNALKKLKLDVAATRVPNLPDANFKSLSELRYKLHKVEDVTHRYFTESALDVEADTTRSMEQLMFQSWDQLNTELEQIKHDALSRVGRLQEAQLASIGSQQWLLILLTIITIILSIIVSLLLSRVLGQRIRTVVEGTQKVRQGDYDLQLPEEPHDDLGLLAKNFNSMSLAISEQLKRERRQQVFLTLLGDLLAKGIAGVPTAELTQWLLVQMVAMPQLELKEAAVYQVDDEGTLLALTAHAGEGNQLLQCSGYSATSCIHCLDQQGEVCTIDNGGKPGTLPTHRAFPLLSAGEMIGVVCLMDAHAQVSEHSSIQRARDRQLQAIGSTLTALMERYRMVEDMADAKADAELANQAKSHFLASMSHEIRTPMNAVLGMAELLRDTPLNEEQQHYVELFHHAGENLLVIINDILDLSRVEAGEIQLEHVSFDLKALCREVGELTHVQLRHKPVDMVIDLAESLPERVYGDRNRLRQVMINLLGNAAKFTEIGEVVLQCTLRDELEPPQICLRICDTGIGIAGEKQATIFEAFTQADASVTRRYGGTGLGLTISKRLVDLMAGSIQLDSALGVGTSFQITIPLQIHEELEEGAAAAESPRLAGMLLLLIQRPYGDASLSEALQQSGAEVQPITPQLLSENIRHIPLQRLRMMIVDLEGLSLKELRMLKQTLFSAPFNNKPHLVIHPEASQSALIWEETEASDRLSRPLDAKQLVGRIEAIEREMWQPVKTMEEGQSLRLLLVEDSEDNITLIQAFLKEDRFQMDVARDGVEGVEKVTQGAYDLVLMDVQMPRMDGYTATRQIRQWERQQNRGRMPIIALTAHAFEEDRQQALDSGCDRHMTKPVRKKQLLALMGECISRKQMAEQGLVENE